MYTDRQRSTPFLKSVNFPVLIIFIRFSSHQEPNAQNYNRITAAAAAVASSYRNSFYPSRGHTVATQERWVGEGLL